MACRKRELSGEESGVPATISDALLFATMCIVGFPVDAHLKDTSVYSGIFFTASLDNNSGIVLKNARMIKKGKSAANVGSGSVVETLVVRFADLLKVVAKGDALPENGVACNIAGDPFKITLDRQKEEVPSSLGNERQAEGDKSLGELDNCDKKSEIHKKEIKYEVQGSLLAVDSCILPSKSIEKVCFNSLSESKGESSDNSLSSSDKLDGQCKSRCSSQNSTPSDGLPSRITPCHHTSTETILPKHSNPTSKVSKLNPGAELFFPSVTDHKSSTLLAIPTVANVAYVPDNCSVGPIATSQPDVEMNTFISRPSLPVKVTPYSNLMAGNGCANSQYTHFFNESVGTGTQEVRYGGQQHHPIHVGATCVASNAQHVMVGRGGQQLIYMHPVSHNVNQAPAAFSQVSPRPSQTPLVGQFLKNQGSVAAQALQLYVNSSFMPGGQQQILMHSHPSVNPPPFPVIHPIPVTGASTGFFTPRLP